MAFPALENKNFRIYIGGQSISLIGTFMQQLAMSWMIYRLTESPKWLGIAGFTGQIPTLIFGLFSGVIVDHFNRHRLLMLTQCLAALQALVLAALTLSGTVALWHLLVLEFFLGTVNAFELTARQAFVVQMVEKKKDLPNAIMINSSVIQLSRLLGPAIGGSLIAIIGEGMCFLINGISYISVFLALYFMKVKKYIPPKFERNQFLREMNVGFKTIFSHPNNRSIIIFLLIISLFGMPYASFFPALAQKAAHPGAQALGWISSCVGVGSLLSALYLSTLKGSPTLAKLAALAAFVFSIALLSISFLNSFAMILFFVFLTGATLVLQLASCNIMIQSTIDDDKRGRVMSIFNISLLGVAPLGSLLMGYVAEHLSLEKAMLINAVFCLLGAVYFLSKSDKVNEYVRSKTA